MSTRWPCDLHSQWVTDVRILGGDRVKMRVSPTQCGWHGRPAFYTVNAY